MRKVDADVHKFDDILLTAGTPMSAPRLDSLEAQAVAARLEYAEEEDYATKMVSAGFARGWTVGTRVGNGFRRCVTERTSCQCFVFCCWYDGSGAT